ncbi:MAG: HAMP domain-containing sensor histidine kinase [Bacteroidota bacterium]
MKWLNSYYNRLNLLAFGVFLLLVLLQSLWLNNAASLQQKETTLQLQQLIPDLAIAVSGLNFKLFHGDHLEISDADLQAIEQVVQNFLDSNRVKKNTPFAIYEEGNTAAFYSNQNQFQSALLASPVKSCLSCIISFSMVSKEEGKRKAGETDEEFSDRLDQVATFKYYAPVENLPNPDKARLWLSLHQPSAFSAAIRSMIGLFLINIILLLVLLFLFNRLQRLLSNYQQLSELKQDFFNNMTHEFKTPLSSIRLASRVLRQHPKAEKARTYHDLIERESKSLELQIDKLLELSLLDRKEIKLEKVPTDVHSLIQAISTRLKPLLEAKQGQIIYDLQSDTSVLNIDEYHLSNSLCNLVENSLKYGTAPVVIQIQTIRVRDTFVIKVQDNGSGIPSAFQPYIFERFFRGQKNEQYKGKGFGIGLSYVKFVMEAHRGSIQLNPNYKQGCEFIIKLPL